MSVEIDGNFIRLAESRLYKRKRIITRLIRRELAPKDAGVSPADIRKVFDEEKIACRRLRLNIPRHLITARFLNIPSTNDEEIAKIMKIESLKHIPYTDEEVVSGYRIAEKLENGYSNVLLAITPANAARDMIHVFKEASMDVESVTLGSEGLLLWYMKASSADTGNNSVLVVNLDTGHADIDIVENNKLVFTRGVLYDDKPEDVIEQIKVSVSTYQKESGKAVEKIVASGVADKAKAYSDIATKELGIAAEAVDQMKDVPCAEGVVLDPAAASFVELIGLALNPGETKIDLLPDDLRKEHEMLLSKKNLKITLILVSLILVLAFAVAAKKTHDKAVSLSRISAEMNRISADVARAKKMMKNIAIIKEAVNEKPLAIDVVSELHKLTPGSISLNMIEFESRKSLVVRGNAGALSEVFKYVAALEGSPYLENVKVKYANKRVTAGKEYADFEVTCSLSVPNAKRGKDAAKKPH